MARLATGAVARRVDEPGAASVSHPAMDIRPRAAVAFVLCLALAAGCDFTRIAANSSSWIIERAAPAFEQYFDYELAGAAAPGNIVQLEGMLRIIPENEIVLLQLMRAYVGYAYGWVEDQAEEYDLAGRADLAQGLRDRARYLYMRARDLGLHLLTVRDDGMEEAMQAGLPAFEEWLDENFTEQEDAVVLLWAGYAWGSYIKSAVENLEVLEGLPYVKALVRRSVELDPDYFHAAGISFLATLAASERYADLDEAKRLFDEALERTDRRALGILLNMAHSYAVAKEDRELYVSLLREILEAGDTLPEGRLANRIAKRRAARYIRRVDELFGPAGGESDAGAEDPAPSPEGEPEGGPSGG